MIDDETEDVSWDDEMLLLWAEVSRRLGIFYREQKKAKLAILAEFGLDEEKWKALAETVSGPLEPGIKQLPTGKAQIEEHTLLLHKNSEKIGTRKSIRYIPNER